MARAAWKTGLTSASTLHEVVNMGGETILLFKFEGKRRNGRTYSVEAYAVKGAETSYKSSGIFYGNVHRLDGNPSTRNCHQQTNGDLLDAMKEAIRHAAWWCNFVEDAGPNLQNAVVDARWTYGSPSVEAIVRARLSEIDAQAAEQRAYDASRKCA